MKYDETQKLRDAFRGKKKPTRRWCEHIETVADEFEKGGLTDFSDPPALIYHLTQRARAGETSREIETYLQQLWAERCPHVAYPEKQTPSRRRRGKPERSLRKQRETAARLQRQTGRLQRLMARFTLLQQKSSWERTATEKAEMANLVTQLKKHGIGVG